MDESTQRWLEAAKHVTANGDTVSTPDFDRASAFLFWAVKEGYQVKVSSNEGGFWVLVATKPL